MSSRICGTEYSELVGMVWRCWPEIMNWWRVPEYGPSKPSARSLRMKSRRLSGRHPGILNLVQIYAGQHGQFVPEFQADENPVLQRGAQLAFAFAQGFSERGHAFQLGNFARERAVFQLVVKRQFQRGFNVGGDRKHLGEKLDDLGRKTSGRFTDAGFHFIPTRTGFGIAAAFRPFAG